MNSQQLKQHICLFSGDITRGGGTERAAVFLANRLAAHPSFRLSIVSITEENSEPAFPIDPSIPRHALSPRWVLPGPGYAPVLFRLIRLAKRERFSVIVDIDTVLDVLSLPCKWLTGVRVVSWSHFQYFELLGTSYRTWCRRLTCRFSDCVVTLTARDADAWERLGRPRCPVRTIPNPANALPPYTPPETREKLVLSAGSLVPIKGFEDVIEIARLLRPRFPGWKFLIVGDGPEKENLLARIRDAGLEDCVILQDFCKDMESLYLRASVYLLTSRSEGLPMVLLEAKYYRLPSVSYDIMSGPSEIILDGVNGYLTPPAQPEAAAKKLARLMESEELQRSFSEHAWDNIGTFDQDAILAQWEELLRSLCT